MEHNSNYIPILQAQLLSESRRAPSRFFAQSAVCQYLPAIAVGVDNLVSRYVVGIVFHHELRYRDGLINVA